MLKINNVVKNFGSLTAIKEINLEIEEGEFFGLLGPNGAGKSTLMNLIIGYLRPDHGIIKINDKQISPNDLSTRNFIGYVPQEIALFLELSAARNLKIFGELYGLSGKLLSKKIDEVLNFVQLTERKKDRVKEYSGGMKRRLNIAVSLLHDPKILLCDEPTVGIDPQSRHAIFDLLVNLNNEKKTILYTTHYMEEAERLCTKLAIIDHGEIIATGTLLELIGNLEKRETIKIQKNITTEAMIDKIKKLGLITETDYHYELIPEKEDSSFLKLFQQFEAIGIPDQFIQISRASLEDVFLSLTGRSMRD